MFKKSLEKYENYIIKKNKKYTLLSFSKEAPYILMFIFFYNRRNSKFVLLKLTKVIFCKYNHQKKKKEIY